VVTPFRDYKILDRVSRQLEKKYGLFVDNGMAQRMDNSAKLSPSARDYESQTWQESFQNHVLGHCDEILKQTAEAKNWQDLHAVLNDYAITLKKRGNGFVLLGPDGQGMKASALDRSMSKAALEKKFGPFKTPVEEQGPDKEKQARPKRRYKRRPTLRHPSMPPLWRKYLGTRKLVPTHSTLLGRSLSNWKLFLISEAWRDPLAMVFLIAQQELLHLVFGTDRPTPVTKLANPALAAWKAAGQWAKAKSLTWLSETRSTGRGCRMDEDGNLLLPFKDRNGHMQAVRLYAPDGRSLDIGNSRARGLTHVIDPKKQINKGPVIFTSDYADAVKIHDATRRPVVVVADPADLGRVIAEHQRRNTEIKPIIAGNANTVLPGIPNVAMPDQDDATGIRRAFAGATNDQAFMVWDACTDWAKPGNAPWLKTAGIRGYGVKLTPDGEVAVPLKDRSGRIENVMLIDKQGQQRLVLDTDPEHPLGHMIDPHRRRDKDTILIARDYADAAALHRATNCPVMVPAEPDGWAALAEQVRERNSDARVVVALDVAEQPDDSEKAAKLGAQIVRPEMASTFKDYAQNRSGRNAAQLLELGRAPYNFDPGKSQSSFVKLQDADGAERTLWGIDIADCVKQSGAAKDDWITLEIAEKKKIQVEERYRDEKGLWQSRTIETHRNLWKAEIVPAPATAPTMATLRNELAQPVGDDAWLVWQNASTPDKKTIAARPEMGTAKAWANYRVDEDGKVLVPLKDSGNRLCAIYQIDQDGSGEILTGPGDDKGLHHIVGGSLSRNPKEPILIADDLISAIELNRLTQKSVVWAVKAENLKAVAENLRRFNPKRKIVIAATDDHTAKENRSKNLARRAAQSVNGVLVVPSFSKNDRKRNVISFGELLLHKDTRQVSEILHKTGLQFSSLPKQSQIPIQR
jgi:phage/plasmid primase-like uncharacterized protein